MVLCRLRERCAEIADSLRAAEGPAFRLLSAVGAGDVTEPYREALLGELAECHREIAGWLSG
jgi:hypothetical protein